MRYKVLQRENNEGIRAKQERKFTSPLWFPHIYYLVERNVNQKGQRTFQKEYRHNCQFTLYIKELILPKEIHIRKKHLHFSPCSASDPLLPPSVQRSDLQCYIKYPYNIHPKCLLFIIAIALQFSHLYQIKLLMKHPLTQQNRIGFGKLIDGKGNY